MLGNFFGGALKRTLSHTIGVTVLIVTLIASVSGVSYALWVSQASAATSATGGDLEVTTNFAQAETLFANHINTATGSFSIKNTTVTSSAAAANFSATLAATGASQLATKLAITVWPAANAGVCTSAATPSGTVASGTWAAPSNAVTGTITPGQTLTYCLRMTGPERGELATASGTLAINPSITVALSMGNWSAGAAATTVQKTQYIFPASNATANTWYQIKNLGTGLCVDVYANTTTSTTGVIDYACKTDTGTGSYNQHWKFSATSSNYATITPRHATALRVDIVGSSTATLAAVEVQTAATRSSQEWQLQQKSAGVYQIVNRNSGMCLQPYNTSRYATEVEYAQAVCNGAANQSYSLTQIAQDVPAVTLACSQAGAGVAYTWSGAAVGDYVFQTKPVSSGSFATVKTAPTGSTTVTILPTDLPSGSVDGQFSVLAKWLTNDLATSNLWRSTTGGVTSLSCTAPVPPFTMSCTTNNANQWWNRSATYSWTPAASSTYTFQALRNGSWVTLGSANAGSSSLTLSDPLDNWATGDYNLRVRNAANVVLDASTQIHVDRYASYFATYSCGGAAQ